MSTGRRGEFPWIKVCSGSPYFEDESGKSWTPIGQNDAVTWPDLAGLYRSKNVEAVEGHLAYLAYHGVTCIRIMLEYCQTENRYFEKPVGKFQANMVQFWDDLFRLCEKHNLRILLTPFDTFWMARRWKYHPYNKLSGGPCKSKFQWLTCSKTIDAIKNRFTFVIERWGRSGVLFAWDLWNEINPVHAKGNSDALHDFIDQISDHIRMTEMELYGQTHLQTVSIFAPHLDKHGIHSILSHPKLDFASTHFYENKTIDYPKNTFDPAKVSGKMIQDVLTRIPLERPFLDTEHGPISYFSKRRKNLPEIFDDEYFLNIQWAHIASGAAGGGMRWPYRHPHVLTHGMRRAQKNLRDFTALINWRRFDRKNVSQEIQVNHSKVAIFGCGDQEQAVIWILKPKEIIGKGTNSSKPLALKLSVLNLRPGRYLIQIWNTISGEIQSLEQWTNGEALDLNFQMQEKNLAIAIRNADSF